jgi:hypothetical protein
MCGWTGSRQMLDRLKEDGDITDLECSSMQAENGGQLNPTWVEWLMGFPPGWTDLDASATPSSPNAHNTSENASSNMKEEVVIEAKNDIISYL